MMAIGLLLLLLVAVATLDRNRLQTSFNVMLNDQSNGLPPTVSNCPVWPIKAVLVGDGVSNIKRSEFLLLVIIEEQRHDPSKWYLINPNPTWTGVACNTLLLSDR